MYYKLIREQAQDKAVVGTLYAISHYYNKRTGEYVEKRTRVQRMIFVRFESRFVRFVSAY